MSDWLLRIYQEPKKFAVSPADFCQLLTEANQEIYDWGTVSGSNATMFLGGCARTVVWIWGKRHLFFRPGILSQYM